MLEIELTPQMQKDEIIKCVKQFIKVKANPPDSEAFWKCLFADQISTLERIEKRQPTYQGG